MDLDTRLSAIQFWVCDVDGVLTDGRIVLDNAGNELKFFDVRDGHGLALLRAAGIQTGILTGRTSQVVTRRAQELGIDHVVQGSSDKTAGLEALLARAGFSTAQMGYMGDDLVDLPVLLRVGFAAAPADAHEEVKKNVHYVTKARGGRGAVREACEMILRAQGRWNPMLEALRTV